nr:MAG TPA: hypothetical protein [Bacteriophage sp.]
MPTTFRALAPTLIVEPSSVRGLAADYPLSRRLGFNLAPSLIFFCFRRIHVCACSALRCSMRALGRPSNSIGDFANTFL